LAVYASVISVNVGLPREVHWRNQCFTTAIAKEPVLGQRRIEGINVVGDDQADRSVHGGRSKAVYAYSIEDYAWWSDQLQTNMHPGLFGENLTVKGIDLNAALIGERWRIGTALAEVSEPRIPCYKLGYRMDDTAFPKRFGAALRFGAYFRIIEEGVVEVGSPITLQVAAEGPTLSVRDVGRIYMFAHEEKYKLCDVSALSLAWRSWGAGLSKEDANPENVAS
jgi:MOSC domain-containing protein YiiM